MRYFLFHKPFGVLSKFTSEDKQRTLAEFGFPKGIYPVGRLDKDSEGLLLLTDDGPMVNDLLNPKNAHPRTYLAQVEGQIDQDALQSLRRGPIIKGNYQTRPCQAEFLEDPPQVEDRDPPIRVRKSIPTSWIKITLTEGKNRQVRRMAAAIGYPVLRLIRVSIASLNLTGLKQGEFREIERNEIENF